MHINEQRSIVDISFRNALTVVLRTAVICITIGLTTYGIVDRVSAVYLQTHQTCK